MTTYKMAIDIGGTFTDFLLIDSKGNSQIFKVLTDISDPSLAVLSGLELMKNSQGLKTMADFLSQVEVIVHGTTITTNAVLTGDGAKTGFLTTKGFRDVLNMRRGLRENQYETKQTQPDPIVPRYLIQTIEERLDCEGKELLPVNKEDLSRAIEMFRKEEVEAIGVSLLFSFFNSLHEKKVAQVLYRELPDVYVTLSSEILPQVRLYERNSTIALNAYVGPILKRYLSNLVEWLKTNNFKGTFLVMQSNGGVMSPEMAIRFAGNSLLSGPAGGPTAGLYYSSKHGLKNIITVDMGGTSFDACLVRDGQPTVTTEACIAQHRVAFPVIDICTIGAGGGSIGWIDSSGLLKVGPQSAGAFPGPACYSKGGDKPTVTDADLVLGYLDADYFYGGRMKLTRDKAVQAIEKEIAIPLKIDVLEAAYGIYLVVNSNMAAELRIISVGRGYDPREFAMVVAGGAGPVHAGIIAKELEIPLVIVPRNSSVFCAMGMLLSDFRHDYVQTYTMSFSSINLNNANALLRKMEGKAITTLKQEGIPQERIIIEYSADVRYEGQFNEVEVPFTGGNKKDIINEEVLFSILQLFHEKHDHLFGYSMPDAPAKFINFRIKARGIVEKPLFMPSVLKGDDASKALKKYRSAFFGNDFIKVPVYDGLVIEFGNKIVGPAIVEEPTTTIIVPPKYNLVCDHYDNFLMHPQNKQLEALIPI